MTLESLRLKPLQIFWYVILSAAFLAVVLQLFTPIIVEHWLWVVLAIFCIQIVQLLMQPLFSWVANATGLVGILITSIFGYAFILWLTLTLLPGFTNVSFLNSVIAGWIHAIFITAFQWAMLAQSDDYFLRQAVRSAAKKPKQQTNKPGFVYVQLDGVSSHVLEWQLKAGNLPNIKKLIDSGEYVLSPWKTQIPSTTPASQAGILFGSNDGIPAFRWFERKQGALVVANQPAGAQLIESRLSDGKGLLADGGVSVGNLFSGDATENIMVMSKMEGNRESLRAMREYSAYFSSLYGFMRAFVLSIGEMIKEIYQARRQKIKDVQPRVPRHGSYIFLRAGTNVLLRNLQTTIVLDKMMCGTNAVYVDYLDYDEIAHHAGIARPEALDALAGLDNVAGILLKAAALTPRPYHVIFVSDHGQSQGPTFRQLHDGKSLEDYVAELLGTDKVLASTAPVEGQSTTRSLLSEGAAGAGVGAASFRSVKKRFERKGTDKSDESGQSQIVVTGSGNLGNVWIKRYDKRPRRAQLGKDYPGFIDSLLKIKGIGLVIVNDDREPVCIGPNGELGLKSGKIKGRNPLKPYASITPEDLLKLATLENAPDVQVISGINTSSGEVYAFEELVGNHGGIGGWQTDAMLLHPSALTIPKKFYKNGVITDSITIHKILKNWQKL